MGGGERYFKGGTVELMWYKGKNWENWEAMDKVKRKWEGRTNKRVGKGKLTLKGFERVIWKPIIL